MDYTLHGYPSMEDSDPLANVPDALLELATLLETRVKLSESASFTVTLASLDTTYTQNLIFPTPYPATPQVMIQPFSDFPHQLFASVSAVSTTQCTFKLRRTGSQPSSCTFHYLIRG